MVRLVIWDAMWPIVTSLWCPKLLWTVFYQTASLAPLAIVSGNILGMGSANERRRYIVTSSLTGWAHNQNDCWGWLPMQMNVPLGWVTSTYSKPKSKDSKTKHICIITISLLGMSLQTPFLCCFSSNIMATHFKIQESNFHEFVTLRSLLLVSNI